MRESRIQAFELPKSAERKLTGATKTGKVWERKTIDCDFGRFAKNRDFPGARTGQFTRVGHRIPTHAKWKSDLSLGGILHPHHDPRPIRIIRHATSFEMFEQCLSGRFECRNVRVAITAEFCGFATVHDC